MELVKKTAEKMKEYLSQIEATLGEETFESLLSMLSDTNKILTSFTAKWDEQKG